ncbi:MULTISPECIES: SDR family oxidoreductase [Caballeronia]|uniref:SDR family oxidoreductase n=1 Tax=Caballeronia TaxID=1827195 RepID=UPI001FD56A6C|nr:MULTISPECIES: SDR family oxidoreductase [Caballeronia]MDR5799123.1 SDR family oxidoreductase [Caballeronia sp. LZ001]
MTVGRLAGKRAIITGGASGMGASQVHWFAREGAVVVIADVDAERGQELARQFDNCVWFERLNVTDETNWTQVVEHSENLLGGPIDILVNNAGILREASLEETTLSEYRLCTEIMQTGVFLGMRSVAPSMRRAGGGSIINVSSTAGIVGYAGIFAYTTAKWAVRGMTKAAALDLAEARIRVNSIHPGNTDTPMIENKGYSVADVPLRRNASVDEISALVTYLASDESRYTTGAEHVIDGGFSVQ